MEKVELEELEPLRIQNKPATIVKINIDNDIKDRSLNKNGTIPKSGLKKRKADDEDPNSFDKLEWEPLTMSSKAILSIQSMVYLTAGKIKGYKTQLPWIILLLYISYVIGAIAYYLTNNNNENNSSLAWCDGLGFLLILTVIILWSLFYYNIIKPYAGKKIWKNALKPFGKGCNKLWNNVIFRSLITATVFIGLGTFLGIDSVENRRKLISAFGIPAILLFGLIISKHPARVVWRHIFWGIALQFLFGLISLRWEFGRGILQCLSDKAATFLTYLTAGTDFVFGFVANGFKHGEFSQPGTFAFGILSVIYYYSFVVAILYHVGALTWVVAKAGWFLQVTIGTTAAESCNAAANIFLGMCEAPLSIKPFMPYLTRSELHAVLTGGFATVAGATMAAYIAMGVSPSHLLSASFMSAPAALALSKLIYPETNVSKTTADKVYEQSERFNEEQGRKSNILEAASEGATHAAKMVKNIIATIVAVISTVAFANAVLNWFGLLIGFNDFSFQWIATKIFYPFAFILGVDNEEVEGVAYLLGLKTATSEFIAYERMGKMDLSPRAKSIATYALCCFANLGAVPVQLSTLLALAPQRKQDLTSIIWRSFIAGNLAAIMTACIAGTLISEPGYAEWKAMNFTMESTNSLTSSLF